MKVKINRAGSFFIGITIFVGVAAVNTGNNLLYMVVSGMLSFMLLSGFLSWQNLRSLKVSVIPPPEVFAGREASFRLLVERSFSVPSFLIKVSAQNSTALLPIVKGKAYAKILLTFPERGYYHHLELTLSSSFPAGLFERYTVYRVELDLIVFPLPIPTRFPMVLDKSSNKKGQKLSKREGFDEVVGVREYMNDPLKLIHWKISAKQGKLYVKRMYDEVDEPVFLSLDMVEGDLEEKVSRLAYLVDKLTTEGVPVGLLLRDRVIEPGVGTQHRRKLLTALALLDKSSRIRT
ncbi:protein of unknown function DUF58 [Thermocrinis albus DSM 14484]|uniref:Uncharacterized protein n=1 Tax=Thermocrinis albus (strain DSM 14484 / JCM 11386 / HI 11/12) TaxID=638303 RepID=D3SLD2_THEAH|nr:DUF58 domain-containing protein [Thermocrinis albus]ADC89562.1 protein of unknown function DUF58 [Thermocrinis albus DSM 14484]